MAEAASLAAGSGDADALAAGKPYVLVIDSNRFRVSPACGRAITMIRYLLDRRRTLGGFLRAKRRGEGDQGCQRERRTGQSNDWH